ncbi:hypothetical protein JHK87_000318 [Glycine soja]|nr:hypothetical protein JHK87_000318 [Glycine soja]
MENLRMLHFFNSHPPWSESNVFLASSLKSLPDGLKILRWDCFPQRSLPQNYWPQNLVRLEMTRCHLEQLWEPDQKLPNLKRLDLSYSGKLIRIPDLYLSPDIEEILLTGCKSLTEVYSSGFLNKLNCLCLNGCDELRSLTILSNILWRSSGLILVSGCYKLETFSISNRTEVVQLSGCSHHDIFLTGKGWYYQEYPRFCVGDTRPLPYALPSRVLRTFDPVVNIDRHEVEDKEEKKEEYPTLSIPNKLCWLDLSNCESLTSLSLEFDLSKLKFLKKLILNGCSKFEIFPEIKDTMENLAVLKLDRTAIKTLPSSLCRLPAQTFAHVNLTGTAIKELPFSFGNLVHLQTLRLNMCTDLESLPNSILKLKLTKLDLSGCSKLRTFPEILEPTQNFAHVNLTETAIKELPFSFGNLVQLQTLRLNMCTDLESLPNSIVNLNLLSVLDCSGCAKLTEIPSDIGCLSLLRELSLSESEIVNLPESIAHLSSLELLDLSECKKLECIPRLPAFLKQLLAFDCQYITTVMPLSNSPIQIPSNSKEGGFRFYFTNGQQLDPGARANIMDEARLRMTEDAYRSVFFCFPGGEVPHWFPFRCEGHSITIHRDSLDFCRNDRLIGFALCVVFQLPDTNDMEGRYGSFSYCLKYESDFRIHILPNNDKLTSHFNWEGRERKLDQDHTFLWKYNLESPGMSGMSRMLPRARSFTFEISPYIDDNYIRRRPSFLSIVRDIKATVKVKECGICPLYTKEKDDDNNADAGGNYGSVRFSKNGIEEPSGSNVAWKEEAL